MVFETGSEDRLPKGTRVRVKAGLFSHSGEVVGVRYEHDTRFYMVQFDETADGHFLDPRPMPEAYVEVIE